jgi:ribonucleoside-triphosphate reductase
MNNYNLLSEEFLSKYKNKRPNWGFGDVGYVVYKRTYARKKEDGSLEDWPETINRCINGAQEIGADYTPEEAERLFDHIFNLRCSFSGRSLWQLGTPLVNNHKIMDSTLNCWVTKVSTIDDFCFIFMESMFGGGVGCNISKEYTQELPRVKTGVKVELKNTNDADFIVPDSKEGWLYLWRKTLEAHLITGKSFTFSTVCVRSSGEPIKTFGGIAPGPKPLIDGIVEINKILSNRSGKKLRTQDVADIICCGGQIVKSGGVRRTALILLGDVDDAAYLNLKRWDLGNIPNYRANSNNSLICNNFEHLSDKFWDGYNGNGEPYGLINLKNAKKYGRTNESEFDGFDLKDDGIIGFNPCAEATLHDKESCNLAEIYLNNIASKEQMLDCAKLLYKTQKAIAAGNYYHDDTNKIVHKNMRLGLGITGICQKMDVLEEWCDYTYRELRKFDKKYSKEKSYPLSIRLTVVKPSGTLSLLGGSTPGGHPGFAKYFIRRIRFSANDPIIQDLRKMNYSIEPEIGFDGSLNHDILVVEFPCKFDKDTLISKNMSAIDQLNLVKKLQQIWADQAVSVTVYYKIDELNEIKKWLKQNYNLNIKSVSFLLHSEHGFKQAPLQEIDENIYIKMRSKIKQINEISNISFDGDIDAQECASGGCPIK